MIQRIQSIYLLLSAGLTSALLGLPLVRTDVPDTPGILGDQVFNLQDDPLLLGLFVVAAALALASIFLFQKRPLQMKLTLVSVLFTVLGLGYAAYLLFFQGSSLSTEQLQVQLGSSFPLLAILSSLLAYRQIKKDENTIKKAYGRLR